MRSGVARQGNGLLELCGCCQMDLRVEDVRGKGCLELILLRSGLCGGAGDRGSRAKE